jgi:zinc/manganese transport system ATP-binding protein
MTAKQQEPAPPPIRMQDAALNLGGRQLWHDLSITVARGEFLAVLGPNGSGKTSLLRTLLGLAELSAGSVQIFGQPPRRGRSRIGYIPQQKGFDPDLPIRGRDLVHFGLDGNRYGIGVHGRRTTARVDEAIATVGATAFADAPVGLLSGGEQQRLRVAQALLSDPDLLLCDEPLLSLDLSHQQAMSALIDERRRQAGTAVVFVTHDINPILPMVDHVLYLVGNRWAVGKPEHVLTSERLSELYNAPVDVLSVRGRILVVGAGESGLSELERHNHEHNHKHEERV